jgi:hypothetical protein
MLAEKNALYRCLDKLLPHKEALFSHLRQTPSCDSYPIIFAGRDQQFQAGYTGRCHPEALAVPRRSCIRPRPVFRRPRMLHSQYLRRRRAGSPHLPVRRRRERRGHPAVRVVQRPPFLGDRLVQGDRRRRGLQRRSVARAVQLRPSRQSSLEVLPVRGSLLRHGRQQGPAVRTVQLHPFHQSSPTARAVRQVQAVRLRREPPPVLAVRTVPLHPFHLSSPVGPRGLTRSPLSVLNASSTLLDLTSALD